MSDPPQLDEHFHDSSVLRDFSLPESKALIDLAFLLIMVDREVTEEELETLRSQLENLPFATRGQAKAALSDHIQRTQRTIATILDNEQAIHSYIDSATQRIQVLDRRRKTLELLSMLSAADEPHSEETGIFADIGASFDLSEEELDEIWLDATADLD